MPPPPPHTHTHTHHHHHHCRPLPWLTPPPPQPGFPINAAEDRLSPSLRALGTGWAPATAAFELCSTVPSAFPATGGAAGTPAPPTVCVAASTGAGAGGAGAGAMASPGREWRAEVVHPAGSLGARPAVRTPFALEDHSPLAPVGRPGELATSAMLVFAAPCAAAMPAPSAMPAAPTSCAVRGPLPKAPPARWAQAAGGTPVPAPVAPGHPCVTCGRPRASPFIGPLPRIDCAPVAVAGPAGTGSGAGAGRAGNWTYTREFGREVLSHPGGIVVLEGFLRQPTARHLCPLLDPGSPLALPALAAGVGDVEADVVNQCPGAFGFNIRGTTHERQSVRGYVGYMNRSRSRPESMVRVGGRVMSGVAAAGDTVPTARRGASVSSAPAVVFAGAGAAAAGGDDAGAGVGAVCTNVGDSAGVGACASTGADAVPAASASPSRAAAPGGGAGAWAWDEAGPAGVRSFSPSHTGESSTTTGSQDSGDECSTGGVGADLGSDGGGRTSGAAVPAGLRSPPCMCVPPQTQYRKRVKAAKQSVRFCVNVDVPLDSEVVGALEVRLRLLLAGWRSTHPCPPRSPACARVLA